MKRMLMVLTVALVVAAMLVVTASPAFAAAPKKTGNQNGCCIVKNGHVTVKKTGNGTQVKH